jgi:curved DNA-binding protein
MHDPWQILGVERGASPDDIKSAYRKLARDHHPDLGGDPNRFIEIQQAYEKLSNPQPQQQSNVNTDPFGGQNPFENIFRDFNIHFGPGFGQFRATVRNSNFELTIPITVAETINGCTRTIQINDQGAVKNLDLHIPLGARPGDTIKYAGMGSHSRSDAPAGDLFVHIQLMPLADYEWQQGHLVCTREISVWQALLGTTVTVSDPFGAQIEVKVPAGSQPGATLRVAGRGGFDRTSRQRADILVKLTVKIPAITPEQQQIIQDWI